MYIYKKMLHISLIFFMAFFLVACGGDNSEKTPTLPENTSPPVIVLNGSSPITLNIGEPFVDLGAVAYDKEDGNLTSKIVTTGRVDTSKVGSYKITYKVTDSGGLSATIDRIVNVYSSDKTPPVITLKPYRCNENNWTISKYDTYVEPSATAQDDVDSDISSKITISGNVDTSISAVYILTYNVTDSAGNAAIPKSREIRVAKAVVRKTNQNITYDENGNTPADNCSLRDDAFYQMGIKSRFTRNSTSNTVKDEINGLNWQDDSDANVSTNKLIDANGGVGVDWDEADAYCKKKLSPDGRLPTAEELLIMFDKSTYNMAFYGVFHNQTPYVGSSGEHVYWASERSAWDNSKVWGVKAEDGRDYIGIDHASNLRYIRCISGTNTIVTNFTRNNDTVIDHRTGLEWQDDGKAPDSSWEVAIAYCEGLHLNGHSDWRMPNIDELYSIVNRATSPANYVEFQNIDGTSVKYWSSSSVIEYKGSAWAIRFNQGSDTWAIKGVNSQNPSPGTYAPRKIMCVRSYIP